MKFIVVEKQNNGVIQKHTYSKFSEVRSFCEEHFEEYVLHMSLASVVSLLEKHSCEFSTVQDKSELVQYI